MFSVFALGNSLFACGVRSARERSFEEAGGETEFGRRLLAPEPRPLPPLVLTPRTRPAGTPNPNLNQRPSCALFCRKLDNSCCYARYSCGNNCNVVVKLVQEYHCFLIHFLFRSAETVRCERYVSQGSEQLQASARVKKLAAVSGFVQFMTWYSVHSVTNSLFNGNY